MVQVAFTLKDFGFSKRLKDRIRRLKDMSGAMDKISFFMWKDVMDHFAKEQGPAGKWKPLKYRKGKILQDTGRLRASIIQRPERKRAILETTVPYAGTHQYGTGRVPQRKFLYLSAGGERNIGQILLEWIKYGRSRI